MPAHHVVAHNWATESENKIHDDEVAWHITHTAIYQAHAAESI